MPKISLKTGKALKNRLPGNHSRTLTLFMGRLAFLAGLSMSACQALPPTAQPIVTPQIWQVQLTPDLAWLEPNLNLCTNRQTNLGLATFERPFAEFGNHPADINLRWGAPAHLTGAAVVLAYDDLVLAVSAGNPIQTLSQKDVQAIYTGKINNWKNFNQSSSFDQKIQAWSYPDGEETQQVFMNFLAANIPIGEPAGFAPTPEAMRQILAANPGAIGYLPEHWLDQNIHKVNLADAPANTLPQVPILAITSSEPTGQQKFWLECLQSTLQP